MKILKGPLNIPKHLKKCISRKDYIKFKFYYDEKISKRTRERAEAIRKEAFIIRAQREELKLKREMEEAENFAKERERQKKEFALSAKSDNWGLPVKVKVCKDRNFAEEYKQCIAKSNYEARQMKSRIAYSMNCLSKPNSFSVVYTSQLDGSNIETKHYDFTNKNKFKKMKNYETNLCNDETLESTHLRLEHFEKSKETKLIGNFLIYSKEHKTAI